MSFTPWTPTNEQLESCQHIVTPIQSKQRIGNPVTPDEVASLVGAVSGVVKSVIPRFEYEFEGATKRAIPNKPGACTAFADAYFTLLTKLQLNPGIAWQPKLFHACVLAVVAGHVIKLESIVKEHQSIPPGGKKNDTSPVIDDIPSKIIRRGFTSTAQKPIFDVMRYANTFTVTPADAVSSRKQLWMPAGTFTVLRVMTGTEGQRFLSVLQ